MKTRQKTKQFAELLDQAQRALTLGDLQRAENIARDLLQKEPEFGAALILLGTILGKRRRFPQAIQYFEKVLESSPDNPEALNNLGVMYRRIGRTREGLRAMQKSLQLNPQSAQMWYNLGNIYKMDDQISDAAAAYTKALDLDPDFILAYNNLGTLYEKMGDFDKATEVFNRGLRSDPNHPSLRYNLGIALQSLGKLEEARKQFEMAVRSRPGWIDGLNNLGIVLQQQEKYDEASAVFQEILALEPRNPTAHNNMATIFAQQGRTQEAIQFFRQALEEKPGYRKAATNLGQLLEKRGSGREIREGFEFLVSHSPEDRALRLQYAATLMAAQDYPKAETQARFVLEREAQNPRALQILGEVCLRTGRKEEGRDYFSQILEHDPDKVDFRLDAARVFRDLQDLDEATDQLDAYLQARPDSAAGQNLYGEILLEQGKFTPALDHFEKIRRRFPDDPAIITNLARIYQEAGSHKAALAAVDQLINLQGRRASPEDINSLNESLELHEKAVEAFAAEHMEAWERNLNRLGELALQSSAEPEEDEEELLSDEFPLQDEDSIPILDFGGHILAEADEEEEILDALMNLDNTPPLGDLPQYGDSSDPFPPSAPPREDQWPPPPSEPPQAYPQTEAPPPIPGDSSRPLPAVPPPATSSPPFPTAPTQSFPVAAPAPPMPFYPPPGAYPPPPGPVFFQPSPPRAGTAPTSAGAAASGREHQQGGPQSPSATGQPPQPEGSFPQIAEPPSPASRRPSSPPEMFPGPGPGLSSPAEPSPPPAMAGAQASIDLPGPAAEDTPPEETPDELDELPDIEIQDLPDLEDDESPASAEDGPPGDEPQDRDQPGGADTPDREEQVFPEPPPSPENDPAEQEPELSESDPAADHGDDFAQGPAGDSDGEPVEDNTEDFAALIPVQEETPMVWEEISPLPSIPAAPSPPEKGGPTRVKPPSPGKSTPVDLLDYLVNLTGDLPEDKRQDFQHSEFRLKIEALKKRLTGGKGLRAAAPPSHREPRPMEPEHIWESMDFFALLAEDLPKPGIGSILSEKIKNIARKFTRGRGK